jgi:hypothetical protein
MWRRKWLVTALLLLVASPTCRKDTKDAGDNLEVVATAGKVAGTACGVPDTWQVGGRILQGTNSGGPQGVVVWANASTTTGNHASFLAPELNARGEFEIPPIPAKIRQDPVVQLTVVARAPEGSRVEKSVLEPKHTSYWATFGVSVGILAFLLNLVLPFWRGEPGHVRYLLSLLLACLFTVTMITALAMGLQRVNTPGRQDDVTPIPFGSIYRGTYDKEVGADWLLSMTSPPADLCGTTAATAQSPQVDKGFGAPLWVLLMSVLGSGILTISLIITEIRSWPEDAAEIRRRIQKMVRHQFFILFAPVGAILVYQGLVAAHAVTNPFAVAIAATGSGMASHSILNEAIRRAGSIIVGSRKDPAASGGPTIND